MQNVTKTMQALHDFIAQFLGAEHTATVFLCYELINVLMAFHVRRSLYAANTYKGIHSQFDQKTLCKNEAKLKKYILIIGK